MIDRTPAIVSRITAFVLRERMTFAEEDSNVFAFGFSDLSTYARFVHIILMRYDATAVQYHANALATHRRNIARGSGTFAVTEEELAEHDEAVELFVTLRLDHEAFYLFAKILLDEVAKAIEYYFGQVRGVSLDSHDQWVKAAETYVAAKKLLISVELIELARQLKKDVSDYRDYEIAHQKSPRAMRAAAFDLDDPRSVRISSGRIYPKDGELSENPALLRDVGGAIGRYLDGVIDVLEGNSAKCRVRRIDEKANGPTT